MKYLQQTVSSYPHIYFLNIQSKGEGTGREIGESGAGEGMVKASEKGTKRGGMKCERKRERRTAGDEQGRERGDDRRRIVEKEKNGT